VVIEAGADLNEIPDCLPKYKAIVERAKAGEKFCDGQFPPNDDSLGDFVMSGGYDLEWKRMGEHREGSLVIFEDGVDACDVT
jgi:hypothetical protein